MTVTNPAAIERLLVYIYGEAEVLQRELESLAGQIAAEERDRFEGTLAALKTKSAALLFAIDHGVTN